MLAGENEAAGEGYWSPGPGFGEEFSSAKTDSPAAIALPKFEELEGKSFVYRYTVDANMTSFGGVPMSEKRVYETKVLVRKVESNRFQFSYWTDRTKVEPAWTGWASYFRDTGSMKEFYYIENTLLFNFPLKVSVSQPTLNDLFPFLGIGFTSDRYPSETWEWTSDYIAVRFSLPKEGQKVGTHFVWKVDVQKGGRKYPSLPMEYEATNANFYIRDDGFLQKFEYVVEGEMTIKSTRGEGTTSYTIELVDSPK